MRRRRGNGGDRGYRRGGCGGLGLGSSWGGGLVDFFGEGNEERVFYF